MSVRIETPNFGMYDAAWGLISDPPTILWNYSNIRWGFGTFSFNPAATTRPGIIASVQAGVNTATQPGTVIFTCNQVTGLTDFIDVRSSVTIKNVVLYDEMTAIPIMWYELDEEVDLSRRMWGFDAEASISPSNQVIRFDPGISLPIYIAAISELEDIYAVPCRETYNDDSMIIRYGPPEEFWVGETSYMYIGNWGYYEDEILYYDLERGYISFDLTTFASISAVELRAAPRVTANVDDQAEDMEIGIYSSQWGPSLAADDWETISPSEMISTNTVSGPSSNGETLVWNIDPTKLIPGQINYIMIADRLESELAYSENYNLTQCLYFSHYAWDPDTNAYWTGILPHLVIRGKKEDS